MNSTAPLKNDLPRSYSRGARCAYTDLLKGTEGWRTAGTFVRVRLVAWVVALAVLCALSWVLEVIKLVKLFELFCRGDCNSIVCSVYSSEGRSRLVPPRLSREAARLLGMAVRVAIATLSAIRSA